MRQSLRYAAAIIILSLALITGLSGCKKKKDSAWEQMLSTGILRVGMDASYPPFEFLDADGQFAGFDVDLANEIGRRLDVETVLAPVCAVSEVADRAEHPVVSG